MSAVGVPYLLEELKRLRMPHLFPHLAVLGIVLNQTQTSGEKLILRQQDVKDRLERHVLDAWTGPDAWGGPVHIFQATIRESAAVPTAASAHLDESKSTVVVRRDTSIADAFQNLVRELKKA
jgi:hypothetical protein